MAGLNKGPAPSGEHGTALRAPILIVIGLRNALIKELGRETKVAWEGMETKVAWEGMETKVAWEGMATKVAWEEWKQK